MRRSPLSFALVIALLAGAQLAGAQRPKDEPKRPRLPVGVDTNNAQVYYDFGLDKRCQVGQPSLGAGDVVAHDHEKALPQIPSECSYDHCIGRTVETANAAASTRTRQGAQQLPEFTQRFEDGEQLWERHGAK